MTQTAKGLNRGTMSEWKPSPCFSAKSSSEIGFISPLGTRSALFRAQGGASFPELRWITSRAHQPGDFRFDARLVLTIRDSEPRTFRWQNPRLRRAVRDH